jgi:hypothetical protein
MPKHVAPQPDRISQPDIDTELDHLKQEHALISHLIAILEQLLQLRGHKRGPKVK